MRNLKLEDQLQAELDVTGTAAADDWVGGPDVGRGAREAEVAARQVLAERSDGVNRMVEDVEHFATELKVEALAELPGFADRTVEIDESGTTENVAAHIAESADRVGIHDGAVLHVAAFFFNQTFL